MLLQFNSSCDEALPVCQAMCCRMRRFYNVNLTTEEGERLKSHWITPNLSEGVNRCVSFKVLDETPEGDCIYLKDGRCSIYQDRPQACREWHCSPGGGMDDPAITKRENGWVLVPAREAHA